MLQFILVYYLLIILKFARIRVGTAKMHKTERKERSNGTEPMKKERVYSTISLYMEPSTKRSLFFTHTYNFENASNEEYLIRVSKYADEASAKTVHRLVFVSGQEKHIPIYRTRLHIDASSLEIFLSPMIHSGERVVHTEYKGNSVSVTRITRGTFPDAEHRSFGSRSELAKEMASMGLAIVEKKKRSDKNEKDRLPKVGTTIKSNRSENSANRDEHPAPRRGRDEPRDQTPSTSNHEPMERIRYITPELTSQLDRLLKKTPMSLDPVDQGLALISDDPTKIDEILINKLNERTTLEISKKDYDLKAFRSGKNDLILLVDGTPVKNFAFYEGVVDLKLLTCQHTGVRFVIGYN